MSDLNPAMYAGVEDTSLPEDELTQQENTRYHLDTMVFGVAYNLSAFAIVFLLLLLYGKTAEIRIVLLLLAALSRVHHHGRGCTHVRNPRHHERAILGSWPPTRTAAHRSEPVRMQNRETTCITN